MKDNILNTRIGIIGGGQLGKMMVQEAKKMGFYITILDPTPDCPAHSISDAHIVAAFDDYDSIQLLCQKSDVVTYEFEHIGADALTRLESAGAVIYPTASSLTVIQNKYTQKQALEKGGVAVPPFMPINNTSDMETAGSVFGYPYLLKTCTGGYDGKGNHVVHTAEEILPAYQALGAGTLPLMAEKFIDYEMEVSVLACRAIDGVTAVYPVARNTHRDNILDETLVPAPIAPTAAVGAMEVSARVMEIFKGVGMFCVELFVDKHGGVLVNEVAPRPHNSGHYTIEACVTSQFEQHIRAITGLPLGDTTLIRPAVMRNLLGEAGHAGKAVFDGVDKALAIKGAKVHVYGKTLTSPKRKMGHITVTADTPAQAAELCEKAWRCIQVIAQESTGGK